jgi:Tol biopolymer transport system component
MWQIALSPQGDRLAYTRSGENGKDDQIWVLPLNRATGTTAGTTHRVSVTEAWEASFSPDGKRLAFNAADSGGMHHIAIIPSTGGAATAVTKPTLANNGTPKWSPDGKSIYYVERPSPQRPNVESTVWRIATTGGAPTRVGAGQHTWPGPSPDGKLFVYSPGARFDDLVVGGPTGAPLARVALSRVDDLGNWIDSASFVAFGAVSARSAQSLAFATGRSVSLGATGTDVVHPSVSLDGKILTHWTTRKADSALLVVMSADGSGRRDIPVKRLLAERTMVNGEQVLSPDGRWIFDRTMPTPPQRTAGLVAIELATGREVTLVPAGIVTVPRWADDSRSVLYMSPKSAPTNPTGETAIEIHRVSLDGTDTVLREDVAPCFCVRIISNSAYIVGGLRQGVSLRNITGGAGTQLAPPDTTVKGQAMPVPSYSEDGRWIAIRRNATSGGFRGLTVLGTRGGAPITLDLPFVALAGNNNPRFTSTPDEAIVAGVGTTADSVSFYRIHLPDGKLTKLATVPNTPNSQADYFMSPSGTFVQYITQPQRTYKLWSVDVSAVVKKP